MKMDISLDELTFDSMGSWPTPVKVAVCLLGFAVILGLGYWLDTSDQMKALNSAQQNEVKLRKEFEIKQGRAASLPRYKLQLVQIQQSFKVLLKHLPDKAEVPRLLEDITRIGVINGLEFKFFDPQIEKNHDFYAELPVRITVMGNYHQLAHFVSRLASMDRIITLHNFNIEKQPKPDTKNIIVSQEVLQMDMIAKTYRYLDKPAQAAQHDKTK
jgi:type IV pilus assembly protein PilO